MLDINVCHDKVYVVINKIVNPMNHTIHKNLIKRYVFNICLSLCEGQRQDYNKTHQ